MPLMRFYLLFVLLLSFSSSDTTCESGQTYVKFVKKCGNYYANEESFEVYSGSTLLYTSPTFANSEERTIEQCLTSSTNDQYTIKLIDSYGDGWYQNSHLTIFGLYGNIVYKNLLTDTKSETHQLSLYYGIHQNEQWRLTSGSATSGWTAYSFSDSDWSQETLGTTTATVSGTQYFRKQFTGLASMAAYDVRLYYRAGVVAYINGNEVYRDNIEPGNVTSSTVATGDYTALAYRGFIRPGAEVSSSQSILAVELHFLSGQAPTSVDFNAYLAILAPSAADTTCFIYADAVDITGTGTTPLNAFDFAATTSYTTYTSNLPVTLTYSFSGPRPYINSVRIWPNTSPAASPSAFTFQGSNDAQTWTPIVTVTGATFESKVYRLFSGYFSASIYNNYRAVITGCAATTMYVFEMQPMICSTAIPTSITFTPNSYSFYVYYEEVSIKPDIDEFTSCTAQNLPAGLSIDSTTCEITGTGTSVVSGVSVTVTSIMNGNSYTGSFTITFIDCTGTMLNVLRTYQFNSYYETFDIKDASTEEVLLSVATNSGQTDYQDWTSVACVTGSKYVVSTGSTNSYWQAASHLYVRSVLSGNQMETILRIRYDTNVGFASSKTFNVNYSIKPHSEWYYRGDITSDWYSSTSTEGWTQGSDSDTHTFTSQIQLYKSTFTVSDINNIAGLVLSIKYKYGIVVYLNGNEAFRNGVSDSTISSSSYGSNIYPDVIYRQISLPLKTSQVGEVSSVNYVQQGSNTIAIGLIATNSQQTEFNFDCAVRLMGDIEESRVFDYDTLYENIYGSANYVFLQFYSYYIYFSSCSDNFMSIIFKNDRREWINAVTLKLYFTQNEEQPHQFTLKARNAGEEWTTLSNVTNLTWSQIGQGHTIYFQNNKAFNEYRFENIGTGDSSDCYWKLTTLDLKSVMTTMTIPELSYGSSITVFKDIEMGEEYPNSEYYYGFTVNPPLPSSITLDPNTGMISGTATAESPAQQYTVTANKLTGGTSTATFSFAVEICTGGRSLVTMVVRTDFYPEQASYKLYQGVGTSGTVVDSTDSFKAPSSLNYGDFCMNDGIYTLELLDSYGDGWYNPAGYYLTVDMGEMIFELGQVPSGVNSVSTMFSSYFPFQINYSDWKVSKEFMDNWNTLNYDDSAWSTVKAANIGSNTEITTYIRHDVNIPDISYYSVLNVRVRYAGGLAAYFNGRMVARFNLEENFNSETESIAIHDSTVFSKFHAIMNTVGGVSGKNVMSFEIHRPLGESSASSVAFDASGIFGVNECSVLVDSYSQIDGTTPYSGTLAEFLDLNPTTYGYQPNLQGTYFEWTVENLEGTKFNSFGIQTPYVSSSFGFSLYVRFNAEDDYTSSLAVLGQEMSSLARNYWSVPVGIAGFTQLMFEIDVPASSVVYVNSFVLQYCKPSGSGVCPGIGDYPSVGEGEISPSTCAEGYRGYSYRVCSNGVLGDIITTNCTQKVPANMEYDAATYNLIMDTNIHIAAPSYMNIIERFYLAEGVSLPSGLTLNSQTGEITGVPTQESTLNAYTIYGGNQVGTVYTVIYLNVRRGVCNADGNFGNTPVGEVAVYECATGGSYIGTQKRACVLGATDGVWEKASGFCISVALIVILIVVVILVIVVVVFIVVRVSRKAKATGGVKGKSKGKVAPAKKTTSKGKNIKPVKV